MKRTLLTVTLLAALASATAPAQRRVSVSIAIGRPAPYVVYQRRPFYHHHRYSGRYDVVPPLVVVVERPRLRHVPHWIVRPRPVVVLRHGRPHGTRHRFYRDDDDDDDDER